MSLISWLEKKLTISHSDNPSLLSMEGLRGIAVFLVFWVHYSALVKPWVHDSVVPFSEFILEMGHLGVDLFFVLSGYLIYGSIISKSVFRPGAYLTRRIVRIYPTFIVVLVVYVLLSFLFPEESKFPDGLSAAIVYFLQNLSLLQSLFDIDPIITVAWSLSYEVFYYLVIPCMIFALRLKSWNSDHRIFLWTTVTAIGFIYFHLHEGPIRLMMFVAGILLFELFVNRQVGLEKWGTTFFVIALLLFGLRSVYVFSYPLSVLAVFILFLLFCLCAFNPKSKAYLWLTFKPLRWLGNMSYSYYLIHSLALRFIFLVFGIFAPDGFTSFGLYFWFWIPAFAATLVVSFLLFWIIELPLSLTRTTT